jgi:AmpD protein
MSQSNRVQSAANEMPLTIEPRSGLLNIAEFLPSPNHDQRQNPLINLLVIHNISLPPGQFGGGDIVNLFLNRLDFTAHPYYELLHGLKASAHLLISRTGAVTQFVPFYLRAWHAGVSCYDGQDQCNDFSIGIELEGTDHIAYTEVQYQLLACITQQLMQYYPGITLERVVGHNTIAPSRKTDPGPAFSWTYFRDLVRK